MNVLKDSNTVVLLAPHIFAARVENVIILLDSKLDDYILIEAHLVDDFVRILSSCGSAGQSQGVSLELDRLIEELHDRGSITSDLDHGKPLEFLDAIGSKLELPGPRIDAIPKVGWQDVAAMAVALTKAFFLLKVRNVHTAIRYVRGLRARSGSPRSSSRDVSDLVEIYHRVRPVFYSSKDQCLFNSLVLILFLAKNGVYPFWCFGVMIHPFMAHCWVEDETWLYNDQYMRTLRYSPIMRV